MEWAHLIIAGLSAAFGGIAGLIGGVWRAAHIEQGLRDSFKTSIDAAEQRLEEKMTLLVHQFQDTFQGLRQKINDVELQTEKTFVSKDGFNEFRREYRQDMASLMAKIDHITVRTDR